MTTVTRSTPTAVPARSTDAGTAAPPKGDYTVKKGDTLWTIAKTLVEQQGAGKASNAQISSALQALKESNPSLCTPARDGGNKIFAGDAITFPKPDGKGWKSATAAGAQVPTAADRATATGQMSALQGQNDADNARRKDSLVQQLGAAAKFSAANPLTAEQKVAVSDLLEQAEAFPELLQTPEAKALQALLPPEAGDATDAAAKPATGTPAATTTAAATPASTTAAATPATTTAAAHDATVANFHKLADFFASHPVTLQNAQLAAKALELIANDPAINTSADAQQVRAKLAAFIDQAKASLGHTGTGGTAPTPGKPTTGQAQVAKATTPDMTVAQGQRNTQSILDTLPPELRNSPQGQELARQLAASVKRGDQN
jgi:hypothetical protein